MLFAPSIVPNHIYVEPPETKVFVEGHPLLLTKVYNSYLIKVMNYTAKTIPELKTLCKERNIKGISGKSKSDLIDLLTVKVPSHTPPSPQLLNLDTLINKVTLGECINIMKTMPPNSIDMVCTDPPYFLDGLGDTWNKESLDSKGSSSVVGNLPKGMKFDRNQSKKFNEFYSKVSTEVFRILKPGGAFLSFSSPRLYHSMAWAIEEAGFEYSGG